MLLLLPLLRLEKGHNNVVVCSLQQAVEQSKQKKSRRKTKYKEKKTNQSTNKKQAVARVRKFVEAFAWCSSLARDHRGAMQSNTARTFGPQNR